MCLLCFEVLSSVLLPGLKLIYPRSLLGLKTFPQGQKGLEGLKGLGDTWPIFLRPLVSSLMKSRRKADVFV